jgi:uncharacterized OB-fold protein
MNGLPDEVVIPQPNMVDREFWEHCANECLMFQACASCGLLRHPPTPYCAACQATRIEWREAPPVGEIYSYTVSHLSQEHGLSDNNSYIIAVVEFPAFGPVRLVTNIEAEPSQMTIGLKVALFWKRVSEDMSLPLFRPVDHQDKA